jgi:hypothetical protein
MKKEKVAYHINITLWASETLMYNKTNQTLMILTRGSWGPEHPWTGGWSLLAVMSDWQCGVADSWPSIVGACCGLICIGAGEERARKVYALRSLSGVERQVGLARGISSCFSWHHVARTWPRWPPGPSSQALMPKDMWWDRRACIRRTRTVTRACLCDEEGCYLTYMPLRGLYHNLSASGSLVICPA